MPSCDRFATFWAFALLLWVGVGADGWAQSPPVANDGANIDGLFYRYGPVPVHETDSDKPTFEAGDIKIGSVATGEIFYTARTLGPGCDDFPTISVLSIPKRGGPDVNAYIGRAEKVIVVCGSDGGQHQMVTLFRRTTPVAIHDFFDVTPNFTYDVTLRAYVIGSPRRDVFNNHMGLIDFPYFYKLHLDPAAVSFVPFFGPTAMTYYLEFYRRQAEFYFAGRERDRTGASARGFVGNALAALVSTESPDVICGGVADLKKRGFDYGQMVEWTRKLPQGGYPSFDLAGCDGK